ncbi:hypothetical protein [Methanoregula sp.]|uniref:hypothetical protein n=1 Tax=Methanoregula sp. TaxID=2052170 RepID=UPI002B586643|nr:hypothetical protein [Methanoregula sp.]HVP97147.1 hypothetical protein [Methanoregula sp.]
MDTGKILMGTAMLLLMIGLVVHPVSAGKTGDMFPAWQETVIGGSGQAPDGSNAACLSGPGSSGSTMHPYERMTTASASFPETPLDFP